MSDKLIFGIDVVLDENECEYECVNKEDSICSFCNGLYKKAYMTFMYDDKIKTKSCILCNTVVNFKNSHMGKCFLINTKITQSDINFKILENFNSEETILNLTDIDPKAKKINLSVYEFINAYVLMNLTDQKLFCDFKIMFTTNIVPSLKNKTINYFNTCNSDDVVVTKYDNSYFNCIEYVLSKKQEEILSNHIDKFKSKQLEQMVIIKKSLSNKCLDAVNKSKLLESIILK